MRRAALVIACVGCGGARPQIAPPVPLDDVRVRLDQHATPPPGWQAKPRWERIRDYDLYEPATTTAETPLAILLHDAGGNRGELGALARHLATHGVRALVPSIDYDDRDFYAAVDAVEMHRRNEQPEKSPTVYVGHGAGGYVAARLGVQSKDVLGSVVIAPAVPPGFPSGKYYGYAGNDNTRMVELDVEHPTGRCTTDALDTAWGMVRNYRTRARLEGASYCSVVGDPQCAARCGGEHRVATGPAFEAVTRVVVAWTSDEGTAETKLLAATPTTKDIEQKAGQVGSDDWAMPSVFGELGGATRDGGTRGALGIRLDHHPIPLTSKLPPFARNYRPKRWGMGGYAEVAWQHDDVDEDDLRIGGGIAFAHSSSAAIALGAHLLLGQHGVTVGADATLHLSPWLAVRVGTTLEDEMAIHGSLMVTIPAGVVAILVPLMMI